MCFALPLAGKRFIIVLNFNQLLYSDRSIYWTCWRGSQGRLFNDLKNVIKETLVFLNGQLQSSQGLDDFVMKFAAILSNHLRAIDILGSIFAYLVSLVGKKQQQFFLKSHALIIAQLSSPPHS